MSQVAITKAFQDWKAQQAIDNSPITLDEFVFAYIPGLDITKPVDIAEAIPAADDIVYRQEVSKAGIINDNAVVYSVTIGADIGDFDFNWIGLVNGESGVLAMVIHAPTQRKIKNAAGQQGNVLVRSMMMEYTGAKAATGITTPADTWQIDFTARLAGMDDRVRKENIDVYGDAAFFYDGFLVSRVESGYVARKGAAYVAGLRAELFDDKDIAIADAPTKVWVDVCWKGMLTSLWNVETKLTVADELQNYSINDEPHYVFAVAEIDSDGNVIDLRGEEIKDVAQQLKEKQPLNDLLTLFSDLDPSKNKIPYFSEKDAISLASVTALTLKILSRDKPEQILKDLGVDNSFILESVYPVGSEYTNYTDNRNPADILGFGVWQPVVGLKAGVGVVVDKNGMSGEYLPGQQAGSWRISVNQIIATNPIALNMNPVGDHQHGYSNKGASGTISMGGRGMGGDQYLNTGWSGGHVPSGWVAIGSGNAVSGEQFFNPYYGCYIWLRIE